MENLIRELQQWQCSFRPVLPALSPVDKFDSVAMLDMCTIGCGTMLFLTSSTSPSTLCVHGGGGGYSVCVGVFLLCVGFPGNCVTDMQK